MGGNPGWMHGRMDGQTLTIPISPPDFVGGDKNPVAHRNFS